VRAFLLVFIAVFVPGVLNVVNSWPAIAADASTAQPLTLQIGIATVVAVVFGIFSAAGLALVAGLVAGEIHVPAGLPPRKGVLAGACVGLALAGAIALARLAAPSLSPAWGNLGPASAFVPFVAAALTPLTGYLVQTLTLLTVLYALHHRSRGSVLWLFVGIALAGTSMETIPSWLVIGVATGIALMLAYQFVFRHQPELLLVATTTMAILSAIRDGMHRMYPAAFPGLLAGALLVAFTVWIWFRGSMESRKF
jgi:hypothetical protein